MFEFTITYYHERYHTGCIDTNITRTGIIKADNLKAAIEILKQADESYIRIADNGVSFIQKGGGLDV